MTLIKAFICTGCLYLPKSYKNAGWAFSDLSLIGAAILTCICALKLIEVRLKTNITSFSEIGYHLYGKPGKYITDISLCVS